MPSSQIIQLAMIVIILKNNNLKVRAPKSVIQIYGSSKSRVFQLYCHEQC